MKLWKRNLIACWFGIIVSNIGLSQIAPVMPLYISQLGISNPALISQISGFVFGVTYVILAIFSPIWGNAADKYGRKPMLLRASFGMAIVIFCMGLAKNVYVLIGLRLIQGAIGGYATACTTLIATQTDKENAGYALGILSTASIAGSLIGPTVGGLLQDVFGLKYVFFITGGLLLISFVTTALFVKESFVKEEKKTLKNKDIWNSIPHKGLTIILSVTFFMITISLYTIEPIVTIYVKQLSHNATHIAFLSGLVFSVSGLANIIAAPRLGKLSDKIGPHKVILVCLIIAAVVYIPQAFVKNVYQLMILRFLLGLTLGGLNPSVNTMIKKITPSSIMGRIFGFTVSAGYLGVFFGSVLGGQIAGAFGISSVFFITASLLSINAIIVYFKVYKKFNTLRVQ